MLLVIMTTPKPWTDSEVLQLEPLWLLCVGRRQAHKSSAVFNGRFHKAFTFPNVLLGSVLSTLTVDLEASPVGLATTLSVIMTLLATTTTFFNFSAKSEGHRATHRGFTLLLREMEMCIIRGRSAPKREFVDFLEYVNDRFTSLIEDAPDLHPAGQRILDEVRNNRPTPFDDIKTMVGIPLDAEEEATVDHVSIPVDPEIPEENKENEASTGGNTQ